MKNEKVKYSLISAICLVVFILIAVFSHANRINENTDIILPSQYIFEGMTSWYFLLVSLIAETVLVRLFIKESYLKSAAISLIMNVVSAVLGFVTLHILSLIVELLFIFVSVGTFHVSHWIVNLILIIPMYAALEGLAVKLFFKQKFRKAFAWLCITNAVSVVICFLFNLSWISEMFF